jgi:hypothetical protein
MGDGYDAAGSSSERCSLTGFVSLASTKIISDVMDEIQHGWSKTSWFVAVNTFVDPAQLTGPKDPKRPATWTQSWTQEHAADGAPYVDRLPE